MTAAVRIIAPLVFLAVCLSAKGQSVDYDYYPYAREQADRPLQTDSILLYRPSAAQDLFSDIVRYVPHPVRFRSRGASYKDDLLAVDGLRLSDAATHAAPYAVVSALYASFAQCRKDAFVADNATGRSGNISLYKSSPTDNLTEATRISLRLTDKSYRFGLRGQTGFIFGNGKWEAALSADMKYGPDSHAGGVFTSSAGYALSIRRHMAGGADISVFTTALASEEGMRSAAVREIQTLTGDNMYNPLWGYKDGKPLNSRIRSGFMPLTVLSARIPLNDRHGIRLALGFICGRSAQSALAWFDAATPMPDYYRYLPSGIGREDIAQTVEERLRANDSRFTQIDWDELVFRNRYSQGHGHYIIEQRIERPRHFHADAGAVYSRGPLTVSYGMRVMAGVTQRYKTASDMLGASHVLNINQYQTEDISFGEHVLCDMRQKDYRVHEGDRIGYDYVIRQNSATLYGQMEYRGRRISACAGAELGGERILREGRFENQLFPGSKSYGPSSPIANAAYTLGANLKALLNPQHSLFLSMNLSGRPADFDDMFLNPAMSNLTHREHAKTLQAQLRLGYDFNLAGLVRLQFSLQAASTDGAVEIIRYYDDLSALFSDAAIHYRGMHSATAEIAVQADLSRRLSLSIAARYGRTIYSRNATATIYSDADGSVTATDTTCRIKGTRPGNIPDAVAIAELSYRHRGWRAKLSAGYYAKRFASINPLFFTSRVSGLAVSPETAALFTKQEPLPAAATANIQVAKTFFTKKSGYITASLSACNLLCSREIIHSAYAQMRIRKTGSGINRSFSPAPNKYLYAYPLTCRLSVSYTFR